jgi:hypothetical protein
VSASLTVVATMPPRNRRVLWVGEEFAAVAFAVWSDGTITPVIEDGRRYVVIGTSYPDTWELAAGSESLSGGRP